MNSAYEILETALLRQLLSSEGLSLSWCEVIQPLIHRVVDTVRPDIKHDNDEMDIRQYVKVKKIPGGSKTECSIVNGVGCSKNVAHKKMQQNLVNPTILLLSNSIVYQRVENKLSSLDPIIMQEHEYLKNIVSKISVYKPNVLLVEKTVSRLAQEMLLDMGITLVLNVKPTVMERVARCTQASIVSSIDAHLGRPHLGVCHYFRVQTFHLSGSKTKTLMFFDGCAANLGCTILLRGGSVAELKKVKQITNFMVYFAYNWQLERSFLMDEFAMPPPLPDELPLIIESSENENKDKCDNIETKKIKYNNATNVKNGSTTNVNNSKLMSRPTTLNLKNIKHPETDIKLKENLEDIQKKKESKYIEDFSDPLRSYLQSEDDSIFHHHGSSLHVASLPFSNQFRKALDDVVLCISPNIKISLPYLETENGRNCELRRFFPEEIYWSEQFLKELEGSGKKNQYIDIEEVSVQSFITNVNQDNIEVLPIHSFLFTKLTTTFQDSIQTQTLLADFRARGGRIRQLCPHEITIREKEKKSQNRGDSFITGINTTLKPELANAGLFWERKVDALSAYNHQRLAILFCSYSNSSNNAPNFCVSPWVVNMDFYGCNDIPLGDFLERYCFRSNYLCPSPNCDTPMTKHVRKFAHENGCVQILLHKLETALPAAQNNIFMWSWCQKCKLTTPVISMSQDTWSLSFAKYLELRFHGTLYTCRAVENCQHALHHSYYQYFAHKQIVATFKYTPIIMREVVLPPLIITIQDDPIPPTAIIEEIKVLAVKGYGIYSTILERLCTLKSECEDTKYEIIINEMMEQQQQERAKFREKIEEIQLKLTSPTLENMQSIPSSLENENNNKDLCNLMWKIADCVLLVKKQIAEAVQGWNFRIQEFVSTRKREEKLPTKVSQLKSLGQALVTDQTEYGTTSTNLMKELSTDTEAEVFVAEYQEEGSENSENNEIRRPDKLKKLVQSETVLHHSQSFDSQPSDISSWKEKSLSLSDITLTDTEFEITDTKNKNKRLSIPRVASAPVCLSDGLEQFFLKTDFEHHQKDFKLAFEEFNKSWERKFQESRKSSQTNDSLRNSADFDSEIADRRQDKEMAVIENELVNTTKILSRGHERSQSDGAEKIYDIRNAKILSRNKIHTEEETSNKPEKKERGTVKTIISQLLSSTAITPIQSPFPLTEHLLLVQSDKIPIIVYEEKPSSIIAYTLASTDYEQQLQELKIGLTTFNATQRESRNSSPSVKRRHQSKSNDNGSNSSEVQSVSGEISPNYTKRAGMLSFFRGNERATSKQRMASTGPLGFDTVQYSVGKMERENFEGEEDFAFCNNQEGEKISSKMGTKTPNFHIEVQFSETNARFY
ncbi:1-phosphatidylinositol 3-phosphate 5-kinase-like isoform X2 [Centruroides vittatus]|uniref:1-phosphatidylinositol 3-phosphate 5-kinase-like isoform X2 n=1 Tax=Centruroides vittatus TaxID=120091 RepID=UPI0035107296